MAKRRKSTKSLTRAKRQKTSETVDQTESSAANLVKPSATLLTLPKEIRLRILEFVVDEFDPYLYPKRRRGLWDYQGRQSDSGEYGYTPSCTVISQLLRDEYFTVLAENRVLKISSGSYSRNPPALPRRNDNAISPRWPSLYLQHVRALTYRARDKKSMRRWLKGSLESLPELFPRLKKLSIRSYLNFDLSRLGHEPSTIEDVESAATSIKLRKTVGRCYRTLKVHLDRLVDRKFLVELQVGLGCFDAQIWEVGRKSSTAEVWRDSCSINATLTELQPGSYEIFAKVSEDFKRWHRCSVEADLKDLSVMFADRKDCSHEDPDTDDDQI